MQDKITLLQKLGKGGYGSVYKCRNETGDIYAVKKIANDENGINCLTEASLMTSFHHPYLNTSRMIHIEKDHIYIFMDLAQSDLDSMKLYSKGENKVPSLDQLRRWTFQLLQALYCLHREQIIHCDVKAANVLLYSNGNVRLSDFTLALKKWSSDAKYQHTICTCTHRPLEVLLGREWDEKVDIWSLGCTLYEIAYGELPFPYQGTGGEAVETKLIRDKCINCILDWARRENQDPGPFTLRKTDFVMATQSPLSLQSEYTEFNDLIAQMLRINPTERKSVLELLQHPFVRPKDQVLRLIPYTIEYADVTPMYESDLILYESMGRAFLQSQHITQDEIILNLGREILRRCGRIHCFALNLRIIACLYLAAKLIPRPPLELGDLKKKILEVEKKICSTLGFRFYFSLPN